MTTYEDHVGLWLMGVDYVDLDLKVSESLYKFSTRVIISGFLVVE